MDNLTCPSSLAEAYTYIPSDQWTKNLFPVILHGSTKKHYFGKRLSDNTKLVMHVPVPFVLYPFLNYGLRGEKVIFYPLGTEP